MNVHCAIFTACELSTDQLVNEIADIVNAKNVFRGFVDTDTIAISVTENSDYNTELQRQFPDGFLHFKFKIDLEAERDYEVHLIDVTNSILKWIWQKNCPAVAAADFENKLTNSGGYNSKAVPWLN